MTRKIPKSIVTLAGIRLEDFPAQVVAFADGLREWMLKICFVIIEEKGAVVDPEKFGEFIARTGVDMSRLTPPDVPGVVVIALNWTTFLPDFELVDDAPPAEKGSL